MEPITPKSTKIGLVMMAFITPFAFLMAVDILGTAFYHETYQNYLPNWASILIAIIFVISFILVMTVKDEKENEVTN